MSEHGYRLNHRSDSMSERSYRTNHRGYPVRVVAGDLDGTSLTLCFDDRVRDERGASPPSDKVIPPPHSSA